MEDYRFSTLIRIQKQLTNRFMAGEYEVFPFLCSVDHLIELLVKVVMDDVCFKMWVDILDDKSKETTYYETD